MADGPNVYAYVQGSPSNAADSLGLCSNSKCKEFANHMYRECVANARKTYKSNMKRIVDHYFKRKKEIKRAMEWCYESHKRWGGSVVDWDYLCMTIEAYLLVGLYEEFVLLRANAQGLYAIERASCKATQLMQIDVCNAECCDP